MKPSLIQYNVGETIHGQNIRLIFSEQNSKRTWTLHRDPADQRDDSAFIAGLTDDVILRMAEAVKANRVASF